MMRRPFWPSVAALSVLLVGCTDGAIAQEYAVWEPAPGQEVGPETQTVEILLRERSCASGRSAEGRIFEPAVDYGEDEVVVTIAVRMLDGEQDCQGNPVTPYTLRLEEPLGDRALLDGASGHPSTPDVDAARTVVE